RGSVVAGINYNKFDEVPAGNREFSASALYLYGGNVYSGGSSRTPSGRVFLPPGPLRDLFSTDGTTPCTSVTRIEGTSGTALDNFRCCNRFADVHNFQPEHVTLTQQERTNVFALANHNLTDNVEAYLKTFINRTSSASLPAPYPFDAQGNGVTV